MSLTAFQREVIEKLDAGANLLWIYVHGDEWRLEQEFRALAPRIPGLGEHDGIVIWNRYKPAGKLSADPLEAMVGILSRNERHLYLMEDMAPYINASTGDNSVRLRRVIIDGCKLKQFAGAIDDGDVFRVPVIISTDPTPHPDLKDYVSIVDFELPGVAYMKNHTVPYTASNIRHGGDGATVVDVEDQQLVSDIAYALAGLSESEAERVLAEAISTTHGDRARLFERIADEKGKAIRKVEGLSFIPHRDVIMEDELGGFEEYLAYLHRRKYSYHPQAARLGVSAPRGVGLIGAPGTGKTVGAKLAARVLGLDLLSMDVGAMYDKYVGASERRMRGALHMVSAMKNCVLLVDEVEKALGDAHKSQGSDAGVGSRVLSYFLTWLSERSRDPESRIFVVVTMNRTAGVPPELLRPGRLDRVFGVCLPDAAQRTDILTIHLKKRGYDLELYGNSLRTIAADMDKYSGAELEEVVVEASSLAFSEFVVKNGEDALEAASRDDVAPTIDHLAEAKTLVKPLALLEPEEIDTMNNFVLTSTSPAGRVVKTGSRRGGRTVRTRKPTNAEDN